MGRVFLSHADTDGDLARFLHDEILKARADIEVFVSSFPGAVPAGEEWLGEIKNQLKAADTYVLLLTSASTSRLWVWYEAGAAFMSGKKVIGICAPGIRKGDIPSPLGSHQLLSLDSVDECRQIFKELGAELASAEEFTESLRSANEKATTHHLNASGWKCLLYKDRHYAWDGPLESLADWQSVECPPELAETMQFSGLMPVFLSPSDRLHAVVSQGYRQVFQTNRQTWKRPVINEKGNLLAIHEATTESKLVAERNAIFWNEWRRFLEELALVTQSPVILRNDSSSALPPLDLSDPFKVRAQLSREDARGRFYVRLDLHGSQFQDKSGRRELRGGWINATLGGGYALGMKDEQEEFCFQVSPDRAYIWEVGREGLALDNSGLAQWCITSLDEYSKRAVEEKRRKEADEKRKIEDERARNSLCLACGEPLKLTDRIARRSIHRTCKPPP